MIVEMVAREIGEAAGRDAHAVEPVLVEAVRGGFQRQMGHALARQLRRACDAARPDRASSASRRPRASASTTPTVPMLAACVAERCPDLPREGRDRGLAAGAGDGGDRRGLARIESARRRARARGARCRPATKATSAAGAGARSADDGDRAGRQRLRARSAARRPWCPARRRTGRPASPRGCRP